jgi:hypothetical protein
MCVTAMKLDVGTAQMRNQGPGTSFFQHTYCILWKIMMKEDLIHDTRGIKCYLYMDDSLVGCGHALSCRISGVLCHHKLNIIIIISQV